MATNPAVTQQEIVRLRGDMKAALAELERRVASGWRGVAGAEARISATRTPRQLTERARDNPTLLGVAGVVVVGAIGYGIFAAVRGARERGKPQNRLKRGVQRVEESVEHSRRQLERQIERARPHGLLLRVEPADDGYLRVTEARLARDKGRQEVIKKFLWAGFLSVCMAVGAVLARRVAGTVWKATVREDPPTRRSRAID